MISKQESKPIKLIKTKTLTIRNIKKLLKQDHKNIPFDGYATKYINY